MTLGETLTCEITSFAYGGEGIARINGCVCFIPGAIPGEQAEVRVTQIKKRFARAELLAVLTPSPDRITPCCRVLDPTSGRLEQVPGCVYDHLAYPREVAAKHAQLISFITRLPHQHAPLILAPFPSPKALHYRNKIVLHIQQTASGMRMGYRREPSHTLLDLPACPLACEAINDTLKEIREDQSLQQPLRNGLNLTLRHTAVEGVRYWINAEPPPLSDTDNTLTEQSPVGNVQVPFDGFYQVNPLVGNQLVHDVAEWFAQDATAAELLELYCGIGILGFACLKAGATRLIGLESGRRAVAYAKQNAAQLGLTATFHCQTLGRATTTLQPWINQPDHTTCLVDPPRDGLAPEVTQALIKSGCRRLIYVSCDPATLTRDLAHFLAGGYHLTRFKLFDMFPRTAHFETLTELYRNK